MKKINFLTAVIASTVIFGVSLPVFAFNAETVSAQAAACIDYSESFNSYSDLWNIDGAGSMRFESGLFNIIQTQKQSTTVYYSNLNNGIDPITFSGNWEVEIKTGGIQQNFLIEGFDFYLQSALKANFVGIDSSSNSEVEEISLELASETSEFTSAFEFGLSAIYTDYVQNISIEDQAPDDIYNRGVRIKIVHENGLISVYKSTGSGDNFVLFSQRSTKADTFYLRFSGSANVGGANSTYEVIYSIDSFNLTCLMPPEPMTEYPDGDVYRFYNLRTRNTHFYTIDKETAQFVYDNSLAGGLWPNVFSQETPTFSAEYKNASEECDTGSPVYRYRNILQGDTHFYAIKADEIDAVENIFTDTFEKEELAFCAFESEEAGTIPVYRWLNTKTGTTHFYTGSDEERDYVDNELKDTFSYEGVAFYAMPV